MSGRTIQFSEIIREIEVEIFASDFDGDPSVGLNYGPECVWAEDKNGNDFPLTEDEIEKFSTKASEIYLDNSSDYE